MHRIAAPGVGVAVERSSSPVRDVAESVDGHDLFVSVVVPTTHWTGMFENCARRVIAILDASEVAAEAVFVLDGPARPAPVWLEHPRVRLLSTGARSGPATARNRAAETARGNVLFFVDSDVELAPDALEILARRLTADGDLVAVFGAYDDEPAARGVASQFRNLLHHHTHVTHAGPAATFWSGCGAIRSAVFADLGGFDERYPVPSVEDIELGMRIVAEGGRIDLDPAVRCKHLKPWTIASMASTDILCRAIPWTRLIMSRRKMPVALNIDWRGRISGVLAVLLAAAVPAACVVSAGLWIALVCAGVLLLLNAGFYGLCLRKRGPCFAIAAVGLHWFFLVYATLTFGITVIRGMLERFGDSPDETTVAAAGDVRGSVQAGR